MRNILISKFRYVIFRVVGEGPRPYAVRYPSK